MTADVENPTLRKPRWLRPWLTVALCGVIFLAGLAAGYGLAIIVPPPLESKRPATAEERCDRLTNHIGDAVDMNAQQREQLRGVIAKRLEAMRETIHPVMGIQVRKLDAQVRSIVTPEQLPAWEAYFQERFSRFVEAADRKENGDSE